MDRTFKQALMRRRSYYALSPRTTIDDNRLTDLLHFVVQYVPSAFNSQSTRLVLLLHEAHRRLWNIVRETLREIVPPAAFGKTEQKIDTSFASGYGTVLFFEDQQVVETLKQQFPTYADNFSLWADQTSAMHQLTLWTLLEEAGMGASLQHYNPLIDKRVREIWQLPADWRLIAQMPFGAAFDTPADKSVNPIEKRVLRFDQ